MTSWPCDLPGRQRLADIQAAIDAIRSHLAVYLLAALSRACHYHPYELALTAAELTSWLDQGAQLVTQVRPASAVPAPSGR